MKRLVMSLVLMLVGLGANSTIAQQVSELSTAWQSGLSYVDSTTSVGLPPNWMFTDRETTTIATAREHRGLNGKVSFYRRGHNVDTEFATIRAGLKKTGGNVFHENGGTLGDAGERFMRYFFVRDRDGKVFYHLAYIDESRKGVNVFRSIWPVPATLDPEAFLEKTGSRIDDRIAPLLNQFYGRPDFTRTVEGLVYNGVVAEGAARVTLHLPAGWIYGKPFKYDTQRWIAPDDASISLSLRVVPGVKMPLKEFSDWYKNAVDEDATARGREITKDRENKAPGLVTPYRRGFESEDETATPEFRYSYHLDLPSPKNEGEFVHFFCVDWFRPTGNDSLVQLSLSVPVKETEFMPRSLEALEVIKRYKPVFSSWEVLPLSN